MGRILNMFKNKDRAIYFSNVRLTMGQFCHMLKDNFFCCILVTKQKAKFIIPSKNRAPEDDFEARISLPFFYIQAIILQSLLYIKY